MDIYVTFCNIIFENIIFTCVTNVLYDGNYFYRFKVLAQTDSIDDFGTIQWHLALSLFVAWLIVFLVLLKGIKSLGKVSYCR